MILKKNISTLINYIKTFKENKVLLPFGIKHIRLESVLYILRKYGLIFNYTLLNNRLCVFRNKYKVLQLYSFKGTKYYSIYKLKTLISKYPDNIYIISTHVGVIDSKDAIALNIGGYALCVIKLKFSIK